MIANLLFLLSTSVLTGFLVRLIGLTALHEHVDTLALKLARLLPPDGLPRVVLGPHLGYRTHGRILPQLLDASIGAGLLVLMCAVVAYAVVVRFGVVRNLRTRDRGDEPRLVTLIRSAARSAALRSSALTIVLTLPVALFSWRLWNIVDFHMSTDLSTMNLKVVNNVATRSSLGAGVGALGRTLVFMAMIALALLTSTWWVERRTLRLAERCRLIDIVCGRCGYAKHGRDPTKPCPECGELNAPPPSPTIQTVTLLILVLLLIPFLTMGPLALALAIGLLLNS